jgi:hypothetical protein
LTFGLGIIILQGVARRKSLAGVNIMLVIFLISEFMFFGPKKEITPWREVMFYRIYPV